MVILNDPCTDMCRSADTIPTLNQPFSDSLVTVAQATLADTPCKTIGQQSADLLTNICQWDHKVQDYHGLQSWLYIQCYCHSKDAPILYLILLKMGSL